MNTGTRMAGPASALLLAAAASAQQSVQVRGVVDLAETRPLRRELPELAVTADELARELPLERRQQFDDLLRDCQRRAKVHLVSAAVWQADAGGWQGVCVADGVDERERAATPHDRLHAASIGKAMTAALVLQAVAADQFELDTAIARWFPDVPNAKAITVDHLLQHTSGLGDAGASPEGGDRNYRTAAQVLADVERATPLFAPGTKWSYCNAGYQLLGLVLEREFDAPLAELLQRRVFAPLGLVDSCVVTRENQRAVLLPSHFRGASGFDAIDYAVPLAAGCVASTPRDLIRWHAALLGGELVPRAIAPRLLDRLLPMADDGLWWGRGLMLLRMPGPIGEVYWSAGGIKGFGSGLLWAPARRAFVCVMVNDETPVGPFLWRLLNAL